MCFRCIERCQNSYLTVIFISMSGCWKLTTRILKIELNVFRKITRWECSGFCKSYILCFLERVTYVRVRRPGSLIRIPLKLQVPDKIAAKAVLETGCACTVTVAALLWVMDGYNPSIGWVSSRSHFLWSRQSHRAWKLEHFFSFLFIKTIIHLLWLTGSPSANIFWEIHLGVFLLTRVGLNWQLL